MKFSLQFTYIPSESLLAGAISCVINVIYTCTRLQVLTMYPESFDFDRRATPFQGLRFTILNTDKTFVKDSFVSMIGRVFDQRLFHEHGSASIRSVTLLLA